MPRRLRESTGGVVYHVLNRAAGRATIFEKPEDYAAFIRCIDHAHESVPMRVLGLVLMPNHFHMVLWPKEDGDLSEFMRRLTVTHTQRWHSHHHTAGTGPLYQGRFKSFPVQRDEHLLAVLRYVDRNPLRARLVRRVEKWRWGSLALANDDRPDWLLPPDAWPTPRPRNWLALVNTPQSPKEEAELQSCIRRGRPFGTIQWTRKTAKQLDLQSTLNPIGRPRVKKPAE